MKRSIVTNRLMIVIVIASVLTAVIGQSFVNKHKSAQAIPGTPTKQIPLTPLPTVFPQPQNPPPSAFVTSVPAVPPPTATLTAQPTSETPLVEDSLPLNTATPVSTDELPDGLKVVFKEQSNGRVNLWVASVMQPELRRRLLTLDDPTEFGIHISLSHNKTKVGYTVLPAGYGHDRLNAELRLVDLATGQQDILATQVDIGSYVNYPLWSPNDEFIVIRRQVTNQSYFSQTLNMIELETGEEALLVASDTNSWLWPIDWSPDGRYLYYTKVEQTTELWRVDIQTRLTEYVNTISEGLPNRCYFFSPDGEWLLCTIQTERDPSQYAVVLISTTSETKRVLISGASDEIYNPIWYSDGQAVTVNLFSTEEKQAYLRVLDLDNDLSSWTVTTMPESMLIPLSWSPDGEWVAIDKFPGRNQSIWLVSQNGADIRTISTSGGIDFVEWLYDTISYQK